MPLKNKAGTGMPPDSARNNEPEVPDGTGTKAVKGVRMLAAARCLVF